MLTAILSLCLVTAPSDGLLVFCADWCGPCQRLERDMREEPIASALRGVRVFHLDVDSRDGKRLARLWRVVHVPTIVAVKIDRSGKGHERCRRVGYDGEKDELARWIHAAR